jgi:hypothetical protein
MAERKLRHSVLFRRADCGACTDSVWKLSQIHSSGAR